MLNKLIFNLCFVDSFQINAALNDEVPSVRSAACRAIGVIACFPRIYHRYIKADESPRFMYCDLSNFHHFCSTEVLEKFIQAVERNAHDSLVSVSFIPLF